MLLVDPFTLASQMVGALWPNISPYGWYPVVLYVVLQYTQILMMANIVFTFLLLR